MPDRFASSGPLDRGRLNYCRLTDIKEYGFLYALAHSVYSCNWEVPYEELNLSNNNLDVVLDAVAKLDIIPPEAEGDLTNRPASVVDNTESAVHIFIKNAIHIKLLK
ncbi:unnamed protein product [Fusarium graminearum]|nr:unnamed protein product [Fusarium graminearum]